MELENGRPKDTEGRLDKEIRVYDLLDSLGIEYQRVDHEKADTMEACSEIDELLQATICKNLFLCNRQKTSYYMLAMVGDKTFKTKKGICFDYAAMMTAMLRSLGIPTKLEIGYLTENVYHSWISVYLEEVGWVDNLIKFNGTDWKLMDPTVASSSGSQEVENMAADKNNYIVRYVR